MSLSLEIREGRCWFHEGTAAEVRALDGIDWTVGKGEFGLVTGPSGSGKTTLLALLGGLERPTGGSVLVDGEDLAAMGDGVRMQIRRRMGLAFAAAPLLPRLSTWENVTYGLVPRGMGVSERRSIAVRWLERLGLEERLRAPAEELSTGERQRAVLARALAGGPEALLVDEPLANLDRSAGRRVLEVLEEFHGAGGTVVVASHEGGAFESAKRGLHLETGRPARTE
ncbi:MAG: ABC transporter ATP-binding protein [Planctomycetota bacterium]|jgi:putative ABC transport system ATP-binding protein